VLNQRENLLNITMCTLICKKFPHIGWVGVKNRDRPAPTQTNLLRDWHGDVERVALVDQQTSWSEGMNSHGISIISSSLTPVVTGGLHKSRDGLILREALTHGTVKETVSLLIEREISGVVFVFDADELWCIEGRSGDHVQVSRGVSSDWIVRTNHGVWMPSAGYQPNQPGILGQRRISSESRLSIGRHIARVAHSPAELITLMAKKWSDEPQLNLLRTPQGQIQTRTTEQLMLVPRWGDVFVRNVDGELLFDQEDANPPGSHVLVGIV
jgi:hypothetical protein